MATYVLVGGAWIGGWAWKQVAQRLRAQGDEVYPVTLTGLGERVHLTRPEIDLDTHITDVVKLMEFEDLHGVILVGHSYAGIVVTGVADRAGDRLAQLVYLDSGPFEDGESMLTISPPEAQAELRQLVEEEGDGWKYPPIGFAELPMSPTLAGLSDADRTLLSSKSVAQPFQTYTQPIRLTSPKPGTFRHVVIACNDFRQLVASGIPRFQIFNPPLWHRYDLETGHWPMLSTPDELSQVLHNLA